MDKNDIEPHVFVIFGGTGDLTKRLILPALFQLSAHSILQGKSKILAVARNTELDDIGYRQLVGEVLNGHGFSMDMQMKNWCDECIFYQSIGEGSENDYKLLAERISEIEHVHGLPGNRAFYLAIPPQAFAETVTGLAGAELNKSKGWTRLVAEKPFGTDLKTATAALKHLKLQGFSEDQIYRIDHFLGKETVQNLLVLRFANTLFEPLWNRDHIESVQITVSEKLGVEKRAAYYDRIGALRDMVQSHLLQLLTLIAMEPPASFDAASIRQEKVKTLGQIAELTAADVVYGQYSSGNGGGDDVTGYRSEPGVAPDSNTETFAALRLEIESWRWQGAPFYLRTGKRMARRLTQIAINFKCPPVSVFSPIKAGCTPEPNKLVLTLQPDEGVDLHFHVKEQGQPIRLSNQKLSFKYADAFGEHIHSAYETLLLDIITGDQTLFVGSDEVVLSWQLLTGLLESKIPIHSYSAGSWGPVESDDLPVKNDNRGWLNP